MHLNVVIKNKEIFHCIRYILKNVSIFFSWRDFKFKDSNNSKNLLEKDRRYCRITFFLGLFGSLGHYFLNKVNKNLNTRKSFLSDDIAVFYNTASNFAITFSYDKQK